MEFGSLCKTKVIISAQLSPFYRVQFFLLGIKATYITFYAPS